MLANLIIETLGWIGTITYLLAYALVSLKKTEGDSVLYQGLSISAGTLLVAYSLYPKAYTTTCLNAIWDVIGLLSFGRKWLTRN
ncbi:MAG: hypothetical protein M3R47_00060 [Chloroflexota bacterium]|nr:hypothetical protein [Chloroflexota bacterium]